LIIRVKIPKCTDAILRVENCRMFIEKTGRLIEICEGKGGTKIYLHLIYRSDKHYREKPIAELDVREAQPDRLVKYCQPLFSKHTPRQ
jgi:hypothetical protein